MQQLTHGDKVQFLYNGTMRTGTIERAWNDHGSRSNYVPAGFCVDHGSGFKSYRKAKAKFVAKIAQQSQGAKAVSE